MFMKSLILSLLFLNSCVFVQAQRSSEDEAPAIKNVISEKHSIPFEEFSTVDSPFLGAEEIQNAGLRSAYEMATLMSTQVEYYGGDDLSIRALPAQIYVDGVKIRGRIGVPQKAIKEVRIVSGSAY